MLDAPTVYGKSLIQLATFCIIQQTMQFVKVFFTRANIPEEYAKIEGARCPRDFTQ